MSRDGWDSNGLCLTGWGPIRHHSGCQKHHCTSVTSVISTDHLLHQPLHLYRDHQDYQQQQYRHQDQDQFLFQHRRQRQRQNPDLRIRHPRNGLSCRHPGLNTVNRMRLRTRLRLVFFHGLHLRQDPNGIRGTSIVCLLGTRQGRLLDRLFIIIILLRLIMHLHLLHHRHILMVTIQHHQHHIRMECLRGHRHTDHRDHHRRHSQRIVPMEQWCHHHTGRRLSHDRTHRQRHHQTCQRQWFAIHRNTR